jgi:hypothetical protein
VTNRGLRPTATMLVRYRDKELHGKTDALVETTIKWEGGMKTRGVHSDQLAAAIQATEHALNMIALRTPPAKGREPRTKRRGALRGMHGTTQHKKIAESRRG